MASFTSGYYVPSSRSKSYVESKRNEEGSLGYLSASQELDMQKQSALQNLEKNYASTIENAYASYLSNQRGLNASAMGQGYKELYQQMNEQQLLSNVAQSNMNLANTRQEISANIQEAQSNLEAQKNQEISNLNRAQGAMVQYLQYVKSLTNEAGESLLNEEQQKMEIDDLYETLLDLSPKTFKDTEGADALGFTDWATSQLKGTEEDTAFGDWLVGGGLADFRTMVAKTNAVNKKLEEQTKKPYNEKLEQEKEAYDPTQSYNFEMKTSIDGRTKLWNKQKDDVVEYKEPNGEIVEYKVVNNTAYVLGAIQNSLKDRDLDKNKLQMYDLLEGRRAGEYYMYLGVDAKGKYRFIQLKK
jgi:DNA-directed RNA polymerase subunit F